MPTSILTRLAATSLLALVPIAASAEGYPVKPVEFVVPFPPGDLEDVLTRMIADEMQAEHGVAAAVVNRPSGGGGPFPGAVSVAQADPDGYTVGSFVVDVPTIGPELGIPDLTADAFEPVGIFLTYPFVIAASANAPYQSIAELADYAADNGVALGHFGAQLLPTRVTMALAASQGFSFSANAAFDSLDCNTLASGDVDVINTTLQLILPCLDDVTVLASIGAQRTPLTPDAPTIGELDPGLNAALWNGLFVPKGTPQSVIDEIATIAEMTVASQAAQDLASQTGALIYWIAADEAKAQIEADLETLSRISALLD